MHPEIIRKIAALIEMGNKISLMLVIIWLGNHGIIILGTLVIQGRMNHPNVSPVITEMFIVLLSNTCPVSNILFAIFISDGGATHFSLAHYSIPISNVPEDVYSWLMYSDLFSI